ncbi:MAG TPA: ABC transporter ATP-binding protein [Anaerolineaceae bacterium]|nr:ABC transporter ATP-binding protein [Anaerolineaceae bacterium]
MGHQKWSQFVQSSDETPKVSRILLRRVLDYAKPYRKQIIGMLVLILLTASLGLISPLILRELIDRTLPEKDLDRLVLLSLALLVVPIASGGLRIIQRRLNASVGEGVIYDLRVALYDRLQRMSLHFFKNTRLGELISRLNNDVIGAQNAISNTIVNLVTNVIQSVAILIVLFTLEWRLTLVSVVIMPVFLVVTKRLARVLREIAQHAMDLNARMNAMMNETLNIGGAILVKLFGRQQTEVNRFEHRAGQVRDIGIRRAVIGVSFFVIIGLVSAIGTALVYGLGGYLVIKDALTIGTIVAFGAYLTSLYSSLEGLANAPVEFATSMVSFERVFEIVDMPDDIPVKPDAIVLKDIKGDLVFENVCFKYDDNSGGLSNVRRFGRADNIDAVLSDQAQEEQKIEEEIQSQARVTALENISFQAKPGQLIALVGPSGAGKTTLTYLIPRLYDPNEGQVLIDGYDLRDVTLDSLSDQIGMVTQETYLFHDTIRTNLSYARLDATQEELEKAAKAANIHHFIMGLPNGYDTIVGERGYRLSGGEKQRIALARVILKDPRILVLDEATSHLDSESEALIQEALKRVMAGRTSIVIAHRLSTILAADRILVIDRGQIVESGTHHELLTLNGLYAHLYQTQFVEKEKTENT